MHHHAKVVVVGQPRRSSYLARAEKLVFLFSLWWSPISPRWLPGYRKRRPPRVFQHGILDIIRLWREQVTRVQK